jgi:acyl carrier protein
MGSSVAGTARHDALFDQVHQTVVSTIIEVVGQEFYEESEITLASTFSEDVELESTEVMEIAERLMETYEDKVDFVAWFGEMELEDLVDLTLRDLIEFMVRSIQEAESRDGAATADAAGQ